MRRSIILFLTFASAFIAWANLPTLNIAMTNGSVNRINVSSSLHINFDGDKMIVVSNSENIQIKIDEVSHFYYALDDACVQEISTNETVLSLDGDEIIVSNIPSTTCVMIHDTSGRLLHREFCNDVCRLNLSQFEFDILILTVGANSYKMIKPSQ